MALKTLLGAAALVLAGMARCYAETVEFVVPDMHCKGCANSIRELLLKEPGVTAVQFEFAKKTITARTATDNALTDDRIRSTVARLNYHVTEIRRLPDAVEPPPGG